MAIAYILDTFPSLSETFIAREIDALRRRGFVIEVFALNAGEGAHLGEGAHPIESGEARKLVAALRSKLGGDSEAKWHGVGAELGHEIRSGCFASLNITHIHGAFASYPAAIAMSAAESSGLTWSFSGHARDLFVDGANWAKKLSSASFASACTRAGTRHLKQFATRDGALVLYAPHGIPIENYEFCEHPFAAPYELLSVGRLVEKKGHAQTLEALQKLRKRGIDAHLTLIGDGAGLETLQSKAKQLKIEEHVTFCGAMAHETVRDAMSAAHLHVFAGVEARDGDRDGLPNVLLEAAALGLVNVATRAGSTADFLDESTGWLCAPGDAEALAQTVARALADETATQAMARAARRRVEEQFSIDANIADLARAFYNC